MHRPNKFKGSWVALVTPFKGQNIDFEAVYRLVDFHLESGTDGILVCGTTGESATLSNDEKLQIMEKIANRAKGKIGLIFGVGSNNTQSTIELVKKSSNTGAEALLVVTPYYNKPTQAGLIAHYQKIAENSNLPIILYNVPGRTGVNISTSTIIELSKIKNIIGIKEASGNLEQIMEIIRKTNSEFCVFSGDDALNYVIMCLGGIGAISVTANIVPRKMKEFTSACLSGDWVTAKKLHFELLDLHKAMFIETNPIPVKTALSAMGLINEEFRLPLVPMSSNNKEQLLQLLKKEGIIAK